MPTVLAKVKKEITSEQFAILAPGNKGFSGEYLGYMK
jgi:hypothetical protein